jgi:hypothetical protein
VTTDKEPLDDSSVFAQQAAQQTMEVVHGALGNYFSWLRKMQSASPWGDTDLNKRLLKYAEQNVNAAFTFAQRLSQAKNMQDAAKIQTEFMQTQINAFSAQAKELGAAFSQSAKTTIKNPIDKTAE